MPFNISLIRKCKCWSAPEVTTYTSESAKVCKQGETCRWIDATLDDCGGHWCNPGIDPGFCQPACNGYISVVTVVEFHSEAGEFQ